MTAFFTRGTLPPVPGDVFSYSGLVTAPQAGTREIPLVTKTGLEIGYMERSHIRVWWSTDGWITINELTRPAGFDFDSTGKKIVLAAPSVAGRSYLVRRDTPVTPYVEFHDGANLTAQQLNRLALVSLYRDQELADATESPGVGKLDDITDVVISNVVNGQVLRWDGQRWVNATPAAPGAKILDELGDVVITTPQSTQVLMFNGSQWTNQSGPPRQLTNLDDVTVSSPQQFQVLAYDGTKWTNIAPTGGPGGGTSITIENSLTSSSTLSALAANQGRVLKGLIDAIPPVPTWATLSGKPALSTVATSGSYNDLGGRPTLSTVATSGSYTDLSNKPAIPSAYTLPPATGSVIGGVKPGTGLTVATDGTLNAVATSYTLPPATATVLGGVKIGNGLTLGAGGLISVSPSYTETSYWDWALNPLNLANASGQMLNCEAGSGANTNVAMASTTFVSLNEISSAGASFAIVFPVVGANSIISISWAVFNGSSGTLKLKTTGLGVRRQRNIFYFWEFPVQVLSSTGTAPMRGQEVTVGITHTGATDGPVIGGPTTLAGLSDTLITTPTSNQILKYDGTRWVNSAAPAGGTTYTLPPATASTLGGVKQGSGVTIAVDGTISAAAQAGTGTDLGYTAATRLLTSSTGADVTLPEATDQAPGLMTTAQVGNLGAAINRTTALEAFTNNLFDSTPSAWTATNYSAGAVVSSGGKFFVAARDAVAADVPGISNKWRDLTLEVIEDKAHSAFVHRVPDSGAAAAGTVLTVVTLGADPVWAPAGRLDLAALPPLP